jgi:hypothetical protein
MNMGDYKLAGAWNKRARAWLKLAAMLALLAAISMALILVAPLLPGMAGEVIENNERQGIQADALFYSEVAELKEFTSEQGRYSFARPVDKSAHGSAGRR